MTLTVTGARVADYNLHLLRKSMYLELAAMLLSEPLTSHNTLARLVTILGLNRGITLRSSGRRARACRFS